MIPRPFASVYRTPPPLQWGGRRSDRLPTCPWEEAEVLNGTWVSTSAPSRKLQCGARGTGVSPPHPTFVALLPPGLPPLPGDGVYLDLQDAAAILLSCNRIS